MIVISILIVATCLAVSAALCSGVFSNKQLELIKNLEDEKAENKEILNKSFQAHFQCEDLRRFIISVEMAFNWNNVGAPPMLIEKFEEEKTNIKHKVSNSLEGDLQPKDVDDFLEKIEYVIATLIRAPNVPAIRHSTNALCHSMTHQILLLHSLAYGHRPTAAEQESYNDLQVKAQEDFLKNMDTKALDPLKNLLKKTRDLWSKNHNKLCEEQRELDRKIVREFAVEARIRYLSIFMQTFSTIGFLTATIINDFP